MEFQLNVHRFSRLKLVTAARQRNDHLRLFWIQLDLLTKARDVHVDGSSKCACNMPPNLFQQFLARHSVSSMFDKVLKQLEFPRCEPHRQAVTSHLALTSIDRQVSKMINILVSIAVNFSAIG